MAYPFASACIKNIFAGIRNIIRNEILFRTKFILKGVEIFRPKN
jgi:hypothetical protein